MKFLKSLPARLIKVCVEGIETVGMRDILRKYNVRSFQGYFYARPLPFDRILEW